jgi:hypothetical protein
MEQAEPPASEPEKGTSDKQAGGQGYPEVGKWESGVTRGAGNQIGMTKWADVVGSKLTRGKANPLKEQSSDSYGSEDDYEIPKKKPVDADFLKRYDYFNKLIPRNYPSGPGSGSDSIADMAKQMRQNTVNRLALGDKVTDHVIKLENGKGFFVDMRDGNFSLALLELREVMFSNAGLIAQIVLSVVGSEIGLPVAFEIMDAAFLINDIYIFSNNNPEAIKFPENLTFWGRLKFLYNNYEDFQRIVMDLIIVATAGTIRTASACWKYLEKLIGPTAEYVSTIAGSPVASESVMTFINIFKTIFSTITNLISKLPKALSNFLKGKLKFYEKFITWIEEKMVQKSVKGLVARAVVKLPMALTVGFGGIWLFDHGESLFKKVFRLNDREVKQVRNGNITQETQDKINNELPESVKVEVNEIATKDDVKERGRKIRQIIKDNKTLFDDIIYKRLVADKSINCKRNEFYTTDKKTINGARVFIVKGIEYYSDNETEQIIRYEK